MKFFNELGITPGKCKGILSVESLQQGWGTLQYRKDICGDEGVPCGETVYKTGFGTHAPSRIRITLQKKAKHFHTVCGPMMDSYTRSLPDVPEMDFSMEANGKTIFSTGGMKLKEFRIADVELPEDVRSFDLVVSGSNHNTHAAWADTRIEFADGAVEDPSEQSAKLSFIQNCPVSFEYDGKSSAELYQETSPVLSSENTEKGEVSTITWTGESLRMKTVITLYKDFPVAEWHTEFDNPSGKRSGRLKNVRVLSAFIGSRRKVFRRRGSFNDPMFGNESASFSGSFEPVMAAESEKEWIFGGVGGRPSDRWLPCFDLIGEHDDIRFVIGWAGQWTADIQAGTDCLTVKAGLEDLDTVLEPGEHISQPSVFMLYAEDGQEPEAANIWRRFVLKHVMMDTPDKAPLSLMHWGGLGEKSQLEHLDDLEKYQIPYDVYWIDAGWFAEKSPNEFSPVWSNNVGDWKFDRESYPEQLKNVAERVHRAGHKLLLWVEPERVIRDRDIAKEHPEYMIFNDSPNALLDLGNPEAWKWCRNTIGKIIEENHLDWYREDFNFEPLEYWRAKDTPDRKGMTEIRFVEGLYRFWKDLRESYPNLMIDNCSSGGRRLDIEMIRYSIPLWDSDMQCYPVFNPDYALVQTEGLAHYLPVFGCGIQNAEGGDTYNFRAAYNAALDVHYFYSAVQPINDRYPREWLKKMIGEYKQVRNLLSGDFYALSESSRLNTTKAWIIFQYAAHDASGNVILVFRPADSPYISRRITPRGIVPEAGYRIHDMDGLVPETVLSGKELLDSGFELELKTARSAAVILIEKI